MLRSSEANGACRARRLPSGCADGEEHRRHRRECLAQARMMIVLVANALVRVIPTDNAPTRVTPFLITEVSMFNEFLGPDYLAGLGRAFSGACADLGVTYTRPHARTLVAKRMLRLADGQRDPEAIRASVVAFFRAVR